jgi:hypothetical protein
MGEQFEGSTGGKTWLAAIACGPAAGTLIVLAIGLIGSLISFAAGGSASFPASLIWLGAFAGALIGWPTMLFLGLPAHVILYRRKSRRASAYVLGGVFVGFIATLIVLGLYAFGGGFMIEGVPLASLAPMFFICLLGSVLASWLFWLIRRPDKDALRADKVAAMFE